MITHLFTSNHEYALLLLCISRRVPARRNISSPNLALKCFPEIYVRIGCLILWTKPSLRYLPLSSSSTWPQICGSASSMTPGIPFIFVKSFEQTLNSLIDVMQNAVLYHLDSRKPLLLIGLELIRMKSARILQRAIVQKFVYNVTEKRDELALTDLRWSEPNYYWQMIAAQVSFWLVHWQVSLWHNHKICRGSYLAHTAWNSEPFSDYYFAPKWKEN